MLTLLLLVHTTYIWRLFLTHIAFVVNLTFNTTLSERLQYLQQAWVRLAEMTESERDK